MADSNRRFGWTRFAVPDPTFSWFVRGVGATSICAALVFGVLLWWHHGKLLDLFGLYEMLDQPGVRDELLQYAKMSAIVTTIAMLGSCGFVIVMAMYFLHRIAGPVYRLKLHMCDIMAGQPVRPVSFRQDDQLRDLADIFNEFMVHTGLLEAGPQQEKPRQEASPAATSAAPPA